MFPGFFEWVWDGGHMLFMGALWYALGIIGAGVAFCVMKSVLDLASDDAGHHAEGHHGDGHH